MGYRQEVMNFVELIKDGSPFVVFDTETTGLKPLENDIIEFSGIKARKTSTGYETMEELDIFINPGYEIPAEITEITGITDDKLAKDGITPFEAVERISEFLGKNPILMGYNSPGFDEPFVNSLFAKAGHGTISPRLHLDVLKMARDKMPKPHKLINMATAAGVDKKYQFHLSIDDAKATFDVFQFLLPMYGEAEKKADFEVTAISRWQKYGFDRVYVSNDKNIPAYYDVTDKRWVSEADADEVRMQALSFAGVTSDEEFVEMYT